MNLELERKLFLSWWYNAKRTLKCDEYDAFEIWLASVNRDGFKLVPVEPTRNMEIAGMSAGAGFVSRRIYKAMVEVYDE